MSADAGLVVLRLGEGAAMLEVWELAGRAASPDDACDMFDLVRTHASCIMCEVKYV
jgi:hypothetical protein